MSGPNRKREVQVNFRVSPQELEMIEQKMAQLGTSNREAYLRKIDVYKRQGLMNTCKAQAEEILLAELINS